MNIINLVGVFILFILTQKDRSGLSTEYDDAKEDKSSELEVGLQSLNGKEPMITKTENKPKHEFEPSNSTIKTILPTNLIPKKYYVLFGTLMVLIAILAQIV